jgi:hypothetical protein
MRLAITLVAAMLVACGQSDKPHKATSAEKKTPTVEELVQTRNSSRSCASNARRIGLLWANCFATG